MSQVDPFSGKFGSLCGVLHFGGEVDVNVGDCSRHLLQVQPVGLDVRLHVVTHD